MRPKLVRDKIPQIIQSKEGVSPITRVLNKNEYERELVDKINEESAELALALENKSNIVEELADILEVVKAIAVYSKSSLSEVNKERMKKLKLRGGFKKRIMLIGKEGVDKTPALK